MRDAYELAVIGSGPGGYAAALASARRGLRTCLIEREQWGGVCLNVGCIPTKAMTASSQFLRRVKTAERLGVRIGSYAVDYPAVRARTARIVTTLRTGLIDLLRREGVELIGGVASFEAAHRLAVSPEGGAQAISAERIVIASGARPVSGPWAFDERRVLSYRGVLSLPELPASLLIIGGGVIGCEFASVFAAFGTAVTIIEPQPHLLPSEDPEAVRWLTRRFQSEGLTIVTGTSVQRLVTSAEGVTAVLSDGSSHTAQQALLAIG